MTTKRFKACITAMTAALLSAASLTSCGGSDTTGNDGGYSAEGHIGIERLDIAASRYHSLDEKQRTIFSDSLAPGFEALWTLQAYMGTPDSMLNIDSYSQSAAVQVFAPDVWKRLGDLKPQQSAIDEITRQFHKLLPSAELPRHIYGAIIPSKDMDVIIIDTVMVIGLNHFLGADYEGYKGAFQNYQTAMKTPSRLPVAIAGEILYKNYPYSQDGSTGTTGTLLNRMLYEGAITATLTRLLPSMPAAEIMGYTPQQWEWLEKNERNGWESMIRRDMIYSTDPAIIERMVLPAPSTSALHPDAPGCAGRYFGYKIVESFIKNSTDGEAQLASLLTPSFYNSDDALQQSKYAPK